MSCSIHEAQASKKVIQGLQHRLALPFWLFVLAILLTGVAQAQMAGYGAIAGTVVDPSGAVIKGATITATLTSQNTKTVRSTTASGDYNVSPLSPGDYTLVVTAKGFETFLQENITVNALQTVPLSVKLTVGGAEQTITVTEAPPVLETSDATLGAVMDNEMYSSLPLLMGAGGNADQRRATDFAALMPGVQNTYTNGSSANATDATGGVNGSNPAGGTQELYIDGTDLPSALGVGDPRPTWSAFGMDSIDQFQVQTIGYSAQYAGQGVQNYSIKQAGNQFHGSAYEYLRNKFLDAWGTNNKTPTATGIVPSGSKCSSSTLTADTAWCKLEGVKPQEVMNEYGIVLSGPIIKNKLFLFYNYGQYRYQKGPSPTLQTLPTYNMMGYDSNGNSQSYADYTGYQTAIAGTSTAAAIYDPATQTQAACSTTCSRTAFASDHIPQARFSAASQYIDSNYLMPLEGSTNQALYTNNVAYGTKSGLSNWYQTGRLDYNLNPAHQISLIVAFGRQSSTGIYSGGTLPAPFNTTQTYHPDTNVDILKDTWTINSHMVNQVSIAASRYVSDSTSTNTQSQYSASTIGILNMPAGQASYFPAIKWSGASGYVPGTWGGYSANNKGNDTYTATDNLQWDRGKHSLTLGGQFTLMQFNIQSPTTYSSPATFTFETAQTLGYSSGKSISNSGAAYASFLLGAAYSGSLSVATPELSPRWKDPSFWLQDNYKLSSKLTLNGGLRWDVWPAVHEKNNYISWLNPTATNPYTGNLGAFSAAGGNSSDGYHTGKSIPSSMWWKNVSPRLGLAYSVNSKTVVRASWGLSFARGNWVADPGQSGSPSTTGLLSSDVTSSTTPGGYAFGSNEPAFYWDGTACSSTNSTHSASNLAGDGLTACGYTGSVLTPSATLPTGVSSMAAYGAYETANMKASNAASLMYWDSYYGSRAPEYENWSLGIERQLNRDTSISISYVGSEGHFIKTSGSTGTYWNNKLGEGYAAMAGYSLASSTGTTYSACSGLSCSYPLLSNKANLNSTNGLTVASGLGFTPQNAFTGGGGYYTSNTVGAYYAAFPQYSGVSAGTSFVGNTNYHALQVVAKQRMSHGFSWMASYTFSKNIDDLGTYRVYDNARLDRSLSAASQPQNLTITGVWRLPLGKGHTFGNNMIYRSITSDWSLSGIGTVRSGQPIIVTGSGCAGSSILNTCMPSLVAGQKGRQYSWGKSASGKNVSWDSSNSNYIGSVNYVNPNAFTVLAAGNCNASNTTATPTGAYHTYNGQAYYVCDGPEDYAYGNAPRVAPMNMFSQKYVNVDMALKRSFPIHNTWKLSLEADVSNVANHATYGVPSCTVQAGSTSSFCTVTGMSSAYNPREAQLAGRISF
ncbi:carboxypeptidase regulatory-like domain-containing protein [Telmatobacter bradus]|uniref:TonB-dependent receptor n=1 Tax=Telmatobacter bradus TaxID=474953 RepID=UPI003B428226